MQNSKGDASTSMERFEFEEERTLDLFSGFVGKTRIVFTALIENIKINIKGYETRIKETTKEIEDNEASREKCAHEITKMENKIADIKDAIENVESTYKKIVDAYSSTSKGDTRELYSEIIDGAKANCDKDVEKNRSEIARLNSDIEAIKNNITEFTKIIDELNRNLEDYSLELYKHNKVLEYMNKVSDKANEDLEEISSRKEILKKAEVKSTRSTASKKSVSKSEDKTTVSKVSKESSAVSKSSAFNTLNNETFKTPTKKVEKEQKPKKEEIYDETLRQIYDLTGYKPSGISIKPEGPKVPAVKEKKVYTDNLESLFSAPESKSVQEKTSSAPKKEEGNPFLNSSFSNWEDILNTPTAAVRQETNVLANSGLEDTVNQLLSPYGTNFKKLVSLVGKEIVHKDGSKVSFTLNPDDLVKAINAIDGNDLKMMKTVGPEVTLLRKVMRMKEGNL